MENAKTKKLYTTHEVAKLLGVTPITVIRWIDSGKFKCYTTVGGHRRIEHDELVRFAQEYNLPWQGDEEIKNRRDFLILVVDDEPDILSMVEDILSDIQGIRLIKANNGFSAGAKLVEERPDLLLLDFKMPELDGFEFTKFIRQDPRFKDIPVVAISGLKADADRQQMMQCGVTEFITKPFSFDDITQTVERFRRLKQEKGSKAA
jgi:two-component system, OmpR family, response regulator VicR